MKNLLTELISINSITPNEFEIGEFLYKYLLKGGFLVEKQKVGKRRFNLFATRGSGKSALLFYGHLDTVPIVNQSQWKSNPFKLTLLNGNYIGIGAYDMKGGIAAFLTAIRDTRAYTKIFLAVDEENISEGAWIAVKEKSDFFTDVDLIISAEPNFGNGLNSVTCGRYGRCIFQFTISGKAAHIAEFQKGTDAIEKAGRNIARIYEFRDKLFQKTGSVIQIRSIHAESIGMSVCGQLELEIEALLSPKDDSKTIKSDLEKLIKEKIEFKPRKTPYLQGYYFESFPCLSELGVIIKKYTRQKMKLITRASVGDDNVLATLGIPVLTWGPNGGNAHTANEFVNAADLEILKKMYKDLLAVREQNKV